MPRVDDNRLKGNYGAAVVMERLSGHCLVRPVAVDTDVGVDLYCESVALGRPFLHFWVQVKAGKQCDVAVDGRSASTPFGREHLEYWHQQPVPVFAALVPTPTWPPQSPPDVFIVNMTEVFQFGDLTPLESGNSMSLQSSHVLRPHRVDDVRQFLDTIVPSTVARLDCKKGVLSSVPTVGPQYLRSNLVMPVRRYSPMIGLQVRLTAAQSIISSCYDFSPEDPDEAAFRRCMARVVAAFEDLGHWENMLACAFSFHMDGAFEKAAAQYEESRSCVLRDPNVRELPEWKERARRLAAMAQLAREGRPLQPDGINLHVSGAA